MYHRPLDYHKQKYFPSKIGDVNNLFKIILLQQ